jgi:hypothetical protein
LDNIEIISSNSEIKPPIVEFISPITGDVYSTGPFTIQAKVKTTSNSPIIHPYLKYISFTNGVYTTDSVKMTHVSGDSLWNATIPQFPAGTAVIYSIKGEDASGNYSIINANYTITMPPSGGQTGHVIIGTGSGSSYFSPYNNWWDRGWSRSL